MTHCPECVAPMFAVSFWPRALCALQPALASCVSISGREARRAIIRPFFFEAGRLPTQPCGYLLAAPARHAARLFDRHDCCSFGGFHFFSSILSMNWIYADTSTGMALISMRSETAAQFESAGGIKRARSRSPSWMASRTSICVAGNRFILRTPSTIGPTARKDRPTPDYLLPDREPPSFLRARK